jgi:hypothetical protein
MQPQQATTTLLSTYPWLDYVLLQKGQAFTNVTTPFYYQPDARLGPGFVCYQAPLKSFVWDSGVSGAVIFNTISGSMNGKPVTINRGQSGMMTDFINGRVILPAASGFTPTNMVLTGTFAYKDFNIYFMNQSQEQIIFSNKYYLNSRFALTGRPPAYDMVTPAIFITNGNSKNDNWAFGGIYNTINTIAINILAENMSQLQGVMSILIDQKNAYMPQLSGGATWPLNFYGDYKPGGWNYQTQIAQSSPGSLYFISSAKATAVSDYAKIDESVMLAIVDLTVERVRSNIH